MPGICVLTIGNNTNTQIHTLQDIIKHKALYIGHNVSQMYILANFGSHGQALQFLEEIIWFPKYPLTHIKLHISKMKVTFLDIDNK